MGIPLRVLIVEDSEDDSLLLLRELRRGGYDPTHERVDTRDAMRAALDRQACDAILCDFSMPHFSAPEALSLLQETGLDLPFIIVSGAVGEDIAVTAMKAGAHDYLLKGNLTRLVPAIERELREVEVRRERRRAEQQVRLQSTALESAANAISITDRQGRITWVNPAFTRLTGYTAEEVLGQNPRILKSGQHDPAFYQELWETILSGQVWQREIINRRKDGSLYTEEQTITPVRDVRGEISHFVAIHHDLTERKRAEAALRAMDEEIRTMTQQLWQAGKLATMGELAASIAHELNNPLGTVSLRVEGLLGQLAEDDPKRPALEVIQEEIERMGKLVTSLLDFSRRGQPSVSSLDVCEELEKTLELIHYHLRDRRVAVVRELAPDVPMLQADRQRLRQLFLNLFTNAADAMPNGGTLTLRVQAISNGELRKSNLPTPSPRPPAPDTHPAPAVLVIEVADTGVGIAPEDLPRVMEPFFTTKPEGKGTGLGLAICRRIVQEHGGSLDLTSQVGKGTTVRIVLPVAHLSNHAYLGGA